MVQLDLLLAEVRHLFERVDRYQDGSDARLIEELLRSIPLVLKEILKEDLILLPCTSSCRREKGYEYVVVHVSLLEVLDDGILVDFREEDHVVHPGDLDILTLPVVHL